MSTKTSRPVADRAGKTGTGTTAQAGFVTLTYAPMINHARLECKPLAELERLHAQAVRLDQPDLAAQLAALITRTGGHIP